MLNQTRADDDNDKDGHLTRSTRSNLSLLPLRNLRAVAEITALWERVRKRESNSFVVIAAAATAAMKLLEIAAALSPPPPSPKESTQPS